MTYNLTENWIRKLWKLYLSELSAMEMEYGSTAYDCDKVLGDIPAEEIIEWVEKCESNLLNVKMRELYDKYKQEVTQ